LNKWLSTLEFYDPQIDSYVSASRLGETMMHRCRLANIPIELIPIVGAMTQRTDSESLPTSRMQDSRGYCAAMGITPSLAGGGPAWFAISTYGPNPDPDEELPDIDAALPLPALQRNRSDNPGILAAAFGRQELAFQLEASAGASPARLRELSEVAIDVIHKTSVLDLTDLLLENKAMEFGADGMHVAAPPIAAKAAREGHPAPALSSSSLYVDARLRIDGQKIRSVSSLRAGGPAKVVFLDIPLSGQWSLDIKLRSRSLDPLFVRAMVIDQRSGQPIGEKSLRPERNEPADLSIVLYRIYGPAAVVVEFSGAEKMEVNFDTLAAK
jgi:hypothetical protein